MFCEYGPRSIFFGFTPCDGRLSEFGLCVPHIYNPVEQEVMAGQFHAPSHPGVLKKCKYEWEYTKEILLIRIYMGANNCGQHALGKNIYFIMWVSPHFQLFYFNERLEFCEFFWMKDQKDNISGEHCITIVIILFQYYYNKYNGII